MSEIECKLGKIRIDNVFKNGSWEQEKKIICTKDPKCEHLCRNSHCIECIYYEPNEEELE